VVLPFAGRRHNSAATCRANPHDAYRCFDRARRRGAVIRPLLACAIILVALSGVGLAQPAPSLSLPIDCTLGRDCFIQQYVDVDPGPGAKDYRCGIASYEGHKGTDFRVLSVKAAEAGVKVLASAAGRVKSVRDGVEDRLIATAADAQAVKDRECGNGVVLDHGGGWETQYCHMRRGSVMVRAGQMVVAGAALGLVGYSGEAQFAHVHLSVRKDGAVVDPFLGEAVNGTCLAPDVRPTSSLWKVDVQPDVAYRDGQIIETGFSGGPVGLAALEQGGVAVPVADSATLVFYARVINLRAGDALRMAVEGPGGFKFAVVGEPAERNRAQFVGMAGQKRGAAPWALGAYRGVVEVIRGGAAIGKAENVVQLQ
jgi:hypothetical protein